MFREKNTPFQVTKSSYEEPISGLVATAMSIGALVTERNDGTVGAANELVLCGLGQRPALLENRVVSEADWQAYQKEDPQYRREIRARVPVGSTVTARYIEEGEFEGTDYFTGIDGSTAVETPLKVVAGKFAIATVAIPDGGGTADRVVAYLVRKMTPHDAASFRWKIAFVR